MQTYLTFPLSTGLAWAAGVGLLFLASYPLDIPLTVGYSGLMVRAADPTDDDRGSGRVSGLSADASLWSFRGSGRVDPNHQTPWQAA
ncbi:MAG: hypothetical protein HC929_03020 [Leptolyngbyaceae cyanobacterium SM2_5_2]|nr:hypothetical protein [Leptolyngbyaceae cyanobacterium SM2_5_2]